MFRGAYTPLQALIQLRSSYGVKGCMTQGPAPTQQFISKYSLWGSNPRPMAHKTIALTTELREPWVAFPSIHNSEEAFLRSQCTVPERAKFIARYNRNAPQGQFHSAVVSEERFAAWKNIVWVISSLREHGMFRLGGGWEHTCSTLHLLTAIPRRMHRISSDLRS